MPVLWYAPDETPGKEAKIMMCNCGTPMFGAACPKCDPDALEYKDHAPTVDVSATNPNDAGDDNMVLRDGVGDEELRAKR